MNWNARYFDVINGQFARQSTDPIFSPGMFLPTLKRHRHLTARTKVFHDAVLHTCDECDAFAWRPL